ncbi:MAG: FkbM family methyltransferase [Saprospiraceae bacterium]
MNFKTALKTPFIQLRKRWLSNNFSPLMWYYQRIWQPKPHRLEAVVDDFAKANKNLFFVQVGGNDGFQNDLICKFVKRYRWQGLTIEPQRKPFETLQKIYQKDKVTPINAAIDSQNTTRKLYKVAFTDARWASGLSSFLRSHLEEKINNGYIEKKAKKTGITLPKNKADWIDFDTINCFTFKTIFQQYKVQQIDLLQIDVEGYDYEILKLFPFGKFLPKMIIFESENLSDSDLTECKSWLNVKGYDLQKFGGDTIGILK